MLLTDSVPMPAPICFEETNTPLLFLLILPVNVLSMATQREYLSFASENDLENILELKPGSVTPLGLLNDKECKTVFYIDSDFVSPNGLIGVHPNDNTATVWLKTDDLIGIIESHGNKVIVTDI